MIFHKRQRVPLCVALILALSTAQSTQASTPCSNHASVCFDAQSCVAAITREAESSSAFWFQNEYSKTCHGRRDQPECKLPHIYLEYTLSLREMLGNLGADLSRIEHFLKVSYKTKTGSYKACGNEYRVTESKTIVLDPLEKSQSLTPFQLSVAPTSFDLIGGRGASAHTKSYYTFVMVDAGYLAVNALFMNLPGKRIHEGEAVIEYEPPLNPTNNPNPYVFLVYEQKDYIYLHPSDKETLSDRNINKAFAHLYKHNLRFPLGLSWVSVKMDPFSADPLNNPESFTNNCVHFVSEAFGKKNIPYLESDPKTLTVNLDVEFDSDPITMSCCCYNYDHDIGRFKLNPIGDGKGTSEGMRSNGRHRFNLLKATTSREKSWDFQNELLTLVMMDPGVPSATYGSDLKPFAHQIVINIKDGDVTKGDEVMPYMGPLPPEDDEPHTYYFLLFQQTGGEIQPRLDEYSTSTSCLPNFKPRCSYEMASFISDNNLKLVGASWANVTKTPYVRCAYVQLGFNETQQCQGVKGFSPGCKLC